MVLFLEVGVDDGEVVKEDGHQVGAIETPVLLIRDILLDKRHTVEIAEEVRAPNVGWLDTLVAEFAEKTAVAVVDLIGDTSEVAEVVVSSHSVDMVDGHACGYLLIAPGYINGMRSMDTFMITETIFQNKVLCFAMRIGFSVLNPTRIFQYFLSVGIDAHTYYAT